MRSRRTGGATKSPTAVGRKPTTILLPGEVLRVGHEEDVFVADVDERELTTIG
jgi:hypothetical protein